MEDSAALNTLDAEKFAGSGRYCHQTRVAWWQRRSAVRSFDPFPLSPPKVALAAALLRKGGYRSATLYLAALKREHITLGFHWDDTLALELRDCTRAALRGLGPPLRAAPFDLDLTSSASSEEVQPSMDLKGPVNARDAVLVASWWMLREIELAAATIQQVSFVDGEGVCGTGTIDLPVSKADTQALGKLRSHVCICPSALCPVAALRRLVRSATSDIAVDDTPAPPSAPLVPDFFGDHVTKKDMVAAFVAVAIACGMDSSVRITGHSPRVAGAQMMARSGISEWRIQVFGRWGSSAVLGYLRDSLIAGAAGAIAREVIQPSLHDVRRTLGANLVEQEAAFERGLRAKPRGNARLAPDDKLLESVRSELAQVRSELSAVAARGVPATVVCTASGKVHVVANCSATHCGWPWSARVGSYSVGESGATDWCRKCCARADRLRMGAEA